MNLNQNIRKVLYSLLCRDSSIGIMSINEQDGNYLINIHFLRGPSVEFTICKNDNTSKMKVNGDVKKVFINIEELLSFIDSDELYE